MNPENRTTVTADGLPATYRGQDQPAGLETGWPRDYQGQTYYGISPIKHSHYKWRTAVAFFCNGLAGGAQILASLAELSDGREHRSVARTGRYLAVTGASLSTLTLISSLHTPERWYNTIRIFKHTSPMSVGIWSISAFTMLSSLAAADQFLQDSGRAPAGSRLGRAAAVPAALLGSLVMNYMGTELEETNMPLWASAHPLMAPLYAGTGISNAAAALLLASGSNRSIRRSLTSLFLTDGAVELGLSALLSAVWRRTPEARFFHDSRYGSGLRMVQTAYAGSLALQLLGRGEKDRGQVSATVASLAKLAAGLLLQFVLVYAGRESGKHPRDYFAYTRAEKIDNRPRQLSLPGADRAGLAAEARKPSRPAHRTGKQKRSPGTGLKLAMVALGTVMLFSTLVRKKD